MRTARRFTLMDVVWIVAFSALGFGVTKGFAKELFAFHNVVIGPDAKLPVGVAVSAVLHAAVATLPMAGAATLCVLVLGLRQPRPPWRRLAAQPGILACFVVPFPMAVRVARFALGISLEYLTDVRSPIRLPSPPFVTTGPPGVSPSSGGPLPNYWPDILKLGPIVIAPSAGLCVAVAWLVLFLTHRWRPVQSWIDFLGRALGAYWICYSLLVTILVSVTQHLM